MSRNTDEAHRQIRQCVQLSVRFILIILFFIFSWGPGAEDFFTIGFDPFYLP